MSKDSNGIYSIDTLENSNEDVYQEDKVNKTKVLIIGSTILGLMVSGYFYYKSTSKNTPIKGSIKKSISYKAKEDNIEYINFHDLDTMEKSETGKIMDTEKIKVLGVGKYGKVYLGKSNGLEVAIKEFEPIDGKDIKKNFKEFANEVMKLSRIRSPNITLLMGVCFQSPHYLIIMEYLNRSLSSLIDDKVQFPKLSIYEKLNIALKITKGLSWLHYNNPPIVHSDFRPSNILLTDKLEPKICDIGFNFLDKMKINASIDQLNTITKYFAPEFLLEKKLELSSNIYSFSLILWRLLTGSNIYTEATTIEELNDIHRNKIRPDLVGVPNELKEFLERGWHHDPSQRPTCKEYGQKIYTTIIKLSVPPNNDEVIDFWKYCGEEITLNWEEWKKKMISYLGLPRNKSTEKTLLNMKEYCAIKDEINISQFGEFLHMFGPFNQKLSFLNEFSQVINEPWFHGDISSSTAFSLLSGKQNGTFLVRKSSEIGCFAFSYMKNKEIKHLRVKRVSEKIFDVGSNNVEASSLLSFVNLVKSKYGLEFPCIGSKFSPQLEKYTIVDNYIK